MTGKAVHGQAAARVKAEERIASLERRVDALERKAG